MNAATRTAPRGPDGPHADLLPGVDLLPETYRRRRDARRVLVWRVGAAVCCAALLAAGVVGGELRLGKLERERDDLRGRAALLPVLTAEATRLRGEIERRGRGRRVAAALRLSPSPTRLLAGVARVLPEQARLDELRLRTGLDPAAPEPDVPNRRRGRAAEEPALPPAAADLARLTGEAGRVRHELELTGTAEDDLALTRLLTGLRSDGCFAETRLVFADVADPPPARGGRRNRAEPDAPDATGTRRRRFSIALVLRRPGEFRVGPPPADLFADGEPAADAVPESVLEPEPQPEPVPEPVADREFLDPLSGPVAGRPKSRW